MAKLDWENLRKRERGHTGKTLAVEGEETREDAAAKWLTKSSTSKKERLTQDQPGDRSAMLRNGRLVLRSDYDDRDENTWRTDIYRELESVRIEKAWNPGWTKLAYRELFGCWPERWMESLHPMPASEALQKWVRSKINAFKRELKKKHGSDAGGALPRSAASTEGKDNEAGAHGEMAKRVGTSDI